MGRQSEPSDARTVSSTGVEPSSCALGVQYCRAASVIRGATLNRMMGRANNSYAAKNIRAESFKLEVVAHTSKTEERAPETALLNLGLLHSRLPPNADSGNTPKGLRRNFEAQRLQFTGTESTFEPTWRRKSGSR